MAAIKGTLIGFLCLLVFVAVGLNVYQYRAYRNAVREVELRQPDYKAPVPDFSETLRDAPDENNGASITAEEAATISELKAELAALEKTLEAANSGYVEIMDREDKKKENKRALYALQMEKIFNSTYMELCGDLNLSPGEIEVFRKWYVERDIEVGEAGTNSILASEDTTEEERDAVRQRQKEVDDAYKEKLRDLLGDADYKKYLEYKGMNRSRKVVKNFMKRLPSEAALSEGQEKELREIWHSGEAVSDYKDWVSYVLEEAGNTLSELQFENFTEFVNSFVNPKVNSDYEPVKVQ